jgi:O-antigen/teichoic acid export membrane protein
MTSGRAKHGLLSGSAIYLASNVCNAAIPFLLLPVLTRYLDATQYGQVTMFQTLVGALTAFVGLNVVGAANRKVFDHDLAREDLALFIGTCLQILLASTVVAMLVLVVFRQSLAAWLGIDVAWVVAAVLVSAATFMVNLRLGQWQVAGEPRKYGALQVGQTLANMGLSLLFVVVFLLGATGRIGAQVLVVPAFALLALALLHRDRLLAFAWRPADLREALGFGVPLVPHIAGLFVLTAADRLVINRELGLAPAGIYMVAVQITMSMAIVFDAINRAYVPWLFERLRRDDAEEKRRIVRWTYVGFAAALAMAGIAFLIGPPITALLAGEEFRPAGALVGWLALGQAFAGMYLMVTNYIFYSKRTGLLSLASLASGGLNVLLLLVLVPRHGLPGAAWAFAIAMAARFLLTWAVAQKRHPMPWFNAAATASVPGNAQ